LDAFPGVFEGSPPVRFVRATRRRRHRTSPVDPRALYDGRVTLAHEVPTRPRCWHDLMNALVWGTFPRAKLALHARQHRAIAARVDPLACRLPPTRTPELDALALFDEGGVLLLGGKTVVFGHAIYESLALGVRPAVVAAIELSTPSEPPDAVLAQVIQDPNRLRTPGELARLDLGWLDGRGPNPRGQA